MGNQQSGPSSPKGDGDGLKKLKTAIQSLYPFLVADSQDSACVVDVVHEDQPIVYVNDLFLQMTLYPREEIIGRNCRFLQGKFTNRETVGKIRNAIKEGVGIDVELVNYRKDGMPFWNNFLLLPVWEIVANKDNANPTHYVAVQKDVTFIKPDLTEPSAWTPETLAVFCDSIGLPILAELVFDFGVTGKDFLDATEEKLALALPLEEVEKAALLSRFLKDSPEEISAYLTACRFSQNDRATLFQSMVDQLEGKTKLPSSSSLVSPRQSHGVLVEEEELGDERKARRRSKGEKKGEKKRERKGSKEKKSLIGNVLSSPRGDPLSFMKVKSSQIGSESVVVKLNIVYEGRRQTDETATGFVTLLNLSQKFTFQELKTALLQSVKTSKYKLYFQQNGEQDFLVESPANFDVCQEISDRWKGVFSFKVVLSKSGKFKKLKKTADKHLPNDDAPAEENEEEKSLPSYEPNMVPGILSNPAATVHLIETMYLHHNKAEVYDLILKWYTSTQKMSTLIDACVSRCIARTRLDDGGTLFRKDQGCQSFLVSYCEHVAGDFRKQFLEPFLTAFLKEEKHPNLIKDSVGKLLMKLIQSVDDFPSEYRQVLVAMTTKMGELPVKFKHYPITTFLFLRFLCPAIVVPSNYEMDMGGDQQNLILLGATLQQVVSAFTNGDENTQYSLELGVLYSKITKRFNVTIETEEIQRQLTFLVSHHDLISATSSFEKAQGGSQKKKEEMEDEVVVEKNKELVVIDKSKELVVIEKNKELAVLVR